MTYVPAYPPVAHGPPYTQADLEQAKAHLRWLVEAEQGDSGNNPNSGRSARQSALLKIEIIEYHLWVQAHNAALKEKRP